MEGTIYEKRMLDLIDAFESEVELLKTDRPDERVGLVEFEEGFSPQSPRRPAAKEVLKTCLKVSEVISGILGSIALFCSNLSDPFMLKVGLTFFSFGWVLSKVPGCIDPAATLGKQLIENLRRDRGLNESKIADVEMSESRQKIKHLLKELQKLKGQLKKMEATASSVVEDLSSSDDSGGVDSSPYPDSDED